LAEDLDLGMALANDVMDRLEKLDAATDAKEALVHIGHAQIALLHAILIETQYNSRVAQIQRSVDRIENAMSEIVEQLREIKDGIDAKRT